LFLTKLGCGGAAYDIPVNKGPIAPHLADCVSPPIVAKRCIFGGRP